MLRLFNRKIVASVLTHPVFRTTRTFTDGDSYGDELDEYEALMCSSDNDPDTGGSQQDAVPPAAMPSIDVLAFLPKDGSTVAVTSLSSLMDTEVITEQYGSLLNYLKTMDDSIQVTKNTTGRFYVGRKVQSTPLQQPVPKKKILQPVRTSQGLQQVSANSDVPTDQSAFEELKALIQDEMHVLQVRSNATESLKSMIKAHGSLGKLISNKFHREFDVSSDHRFVAPVGTLSSNCSRQMIAQRSQKPTDEPTPWEVELDVADDDVLIEEEMAARSQSTQGASADDDSLWEREYSAMKKQQQEVFKLSDAIPEAPTAPPDEPLPSIPVPTTAAAVKKTPPPIPAVNTKSMLETHTALAVERGWKTPQQMLDVFVRIIPTYFIDANFIKLDDDSLKVLGSGKLSKFVRVYAYFFDVKKSDGNVLVRLKDSVEHHQKGVADAKYKAYVSPRLRRTEGGPNLSTLTRVATNTTTTTSITSKKWGPPSAQAPPQQAVSPPPDTKAHVDCLITKINCCQWYSAAEIDSLLTDTTAEQLALQSPDILLSRKGNEYALRPFWMAPGCLASVPEKDSPNPKLLEIGKKAVKISGVWVPLQKCENDVLAGGGTILQLADVLRHHGELFWVDVAGHRARRFSGNPQLDDLRHYCVPAIKATLDKAGAVGGKMLPLKEVASKLPIGVKTMMERSVAQFGVKKLATFLKAYNRDFDIKQEAGGAVFIGKASVFAAQATGAATVAGGSSWGSFANRR